jgi:DNA helicase HerA-like ATPase
VRIFLSRLRGGSQPDDAQFEYIALSRGKGEPVEILCSTTADTETFRDRLREIYPDTFDIQIVSESLQQHLIRPVELSPEQFVREATENNLHLPPDALKHVSVGGDVPVIPPERERLETDTLIAELNNENLILEEQTPVDVEQRVQDDRSHEPEQTHPGASPGDTAGEKAGEKEPIETTGLSANGHGGNGEAHETGETPGEEHTDRETPAFGPKDVDTPAHEKKLSPTSDGGPTATAQTSTHDANSGGDTNTEEDTSSSFSPTTGKILGAPVWVLDTEDIPTSSPTAEGAPSTEAAGEEWEHASEDSPADEASEGSASDDEDTDTDADADDTENTELGVETDTQPPQTTDEDSPSAEDGEDEGEDADDTQSLDTLTGAAAELTGDADAVVSLPVAPATEEEFLSALLSDDDHAGTLAEHEVVAVRVDECGLLLSLDVADLSRDWIDQSDYADADADEHDDALPEPSDKDGNRILGEHVYKPMPLDRDIPFSNRLEQHHKLDIDYAANEFETPDDSGEFTVRSCYIRIAATEERVNRGQPIPADDPLVNGTDIPDLILDHLLILQPPSELPDNGNYTELDHPTLTEDGTILARPSIEYTDPYAVKWEGEAEEMDDWMTPLATGDHDSDGQPSDRMFSLSPLSTLFDHLTECVEPTAYQVVFEPKDTWSRRRDERMNDIQRDNDGNILDKAIQEALSEVDVEELNNQDRSPPPRIEQMEEKSGQNAFSVNVRAVSLDALAHMGTDPLAEEGPADTHGSTAPHSRGAEIKSELSSLTALLDPLDGEFYSIEGRYVTDEEERLETVLQFFRGDIETAVDDSSLIGWFDDAHWPELVLSPDELANLILTPPGGHLSKTSQRGTQAKAIEQEPLPKPDPDILQQYQGVDGVQLGYALDEDRDHDGEPVVVPTEKLTEHYLRAASTGHGKSIGVINDMLSLRKTTSGPNVLVDPKGGRMAYNYLRSHYVEFGDLEDVYFFRVPDNLPAISFFDIRPQLANGQDRKTAIQDTINHFHDILRMIMGYSVYDGAFVAKEIISFILRALFDKKYGQNSFTFDEFREAVQAYHEKGKIPRVSDDNEHVEEVLSEKLQGADDDSFDASMDAVKNRLNKISEYDYLLEIFNHDPEWDDRKDEYKENITPGDDREGDPNPVFHFEEILNDDVTILFDVGDLRSGAQDAFAVLLLSNLWDSIQKRGREREDRDEIVNLIIDEAASVAGTTLVYEELLPQGRGFGLSMGLVMQFPQQVDYGGDAGRRAYNEVLNNIGTKLIGNIQIEERLSKALAHEELSQEEVRNRIGALPSGEWIADLPEAGFGSQPPEPFSLAPLPIPDGHPDGQHPLPDNADDGFDEYYVRHVQSRTSEQHGLGPLKRDERDGHENPFADDNTFGADDTDSDSPEDGESGGGDGGEGLFSVGGGGGDGDDEAGDGRASGLDETEYGLPDFEQHTFSDLEGVKGVARSVIMETPTEAVEMRLLADLAEIAQEAGYDVTGGELMGVRDTLDEERIREEKAASERGPAGLDAAHATGTDADSGATTPANDDADVHPELDRLSLDGDSGDERQQGGEAPGTEDAGPAADTGAATADAADAQEEAAEQPPAGPGGDDSTAQTLAEELDQRMLAKAVDRADLSEHGVTREEARFMGAVVAAMNRRLDNYSLLEPMSELEEHFDGEEIDVAKLEEKNFLEKHRLFQYQTYYTVPDAGLRFLSQQAIFGFQNGDLGEKTPHRVGVDYATAWLKEHDTVSYVKQYYEEQKDRDYDVAAFSEDGDLEYVVEIELDSNNADAIKSDYEKLSEAVEDHGARALWISNSKDNVESILSTLADAGKFEPVPKRDQRSFSDINSALTERDATGMHEIWGMKSVKKKVE